MERSYVRDKIESCRRDFCIDFCLHTYSWSPRRGRMRLWVHGCRRRDACHYSEVEFVETPCARFFVRRSLHALSVPSLLFQKVEMCLHQDLEHVREIISVPSNSLDRVCLQHFPRRCIHSTILITGLPPCVFPGKKIMWTRSPHFFHTAS